MRVFCNSLVSVGMAAAMITALPVLAAESEEDPATVGITLTQDVLDQIVASGQNPAAIVRVEDLCPKDLAPTS